MNVLPDEVLAHRLAMIPIPTNLEEPLYTPTECINCKDVIERDRGMPSVPGALHPFRSWTLGRR